MALENILHDYTNYTYRITLFFLTSEDYNLLAASPDTFIPKYSLISSAGGYARTTGSTTTVPAGGQSGTVYETTRHPDFRTDFYIDNLQLQTIVGLNSKTKATNAVDISFTITEPYGLSLLDRLLSACETSKDNITNYMAQPYLLQLDILANPTDEKLINLRQTNNVIISKKFPIKLLELKIKPSASGTVYSCRAMPFNHIAFNTTVASVPITLNVEASTVGEFFGGSDDVARIFIGQLKSDEERIEKDLEEWKNEVVAVGGVPPSAQQISERRKQLRDGIAVVTRSFTAAYNSYNEKVAKDQKLSQLPPTKIAFNIPDSEIAGSEIIEIERQSKDTRMGDPKKGVQVAGTDPDFKKKQTFTINHGTSIIDVVDMVMGKSKYIKDNLVKNQAESNNVTQRDSQEENSKKIKWYKIIPTVALTDFDKKLNTYSKTVLYSILPYETINVNHPNASVTTAQNIEELVVRTYDYLYTGKNKDILKLDIDFDTTFYTQISSYRNQLSRNGNDFSSDENDAAQAETEFTVNQTGAFNTMPPRELAVGGSNRSAVGVASSTSPDENVIADIKKSLYTSQRGDNLNIKLQIIGDPAFIKQDDIFFNPGSVEDYDNYSQLTNQGSQKIPVNNSGQILFDAQQVYVKLIVKNFVDINDSLALVNKQDILSNGRTTDGTFSGVYRVLSVQSEFSKGQFTQTLDMIRIPEPLAKIKSPAVTSVTNKSIPNQASKAPPLGVLNQGIITV